MNNMPMKYSVLSELTRNELMQIFSNYGVVVIVSTNLFVKAEFQSAIVWYELDLNGLVVSVISYHTLGIRHAAMLRSASVDITLETDQPTTPIESLTDAFTLLDELDVLEQSLHSAITINDNACNNNNDVVKRLMGNPPYLPI